MTAIPGIVREIIAARSDVGFGRAHFFRYGDWSLDFEVIYHFKSPDYILHMDASRTSCCRSIAPSSARKSSLRIRSRWCASPEPAIRPAAGRRCRPEAAAR
ncbi:hypothetical protein [Telluria aromaticivorans]|uniref:Uncharacterized protein n=1 Tax=Telluria aromaticivorans TaxID=2725995 RepID=A0A7Y2NXY7_9BURK|nr:hypothetical protein [Telluria aromaticivorans]NNG21508.1 hypothetical protein [Telluria aromaticivorans]